MKVAGFRLPLAVILVCLTVHAEPGDPGSRPVLVGTSPRTIPKGQPITQLDEEAYSQDLVEIVAKNAGLKYQFVEYASWGEMMAALEQGRLDVVPTVARIPERQGRMLFTVPHVKGGLVLLLGPGVRPPARLEDIPHLKLLLEPDTLQYTYAKNRGWTDNAIVRPLSGLGGEIKALADGTAEATILNEFSAIALIHSTNMEGKVSIAMTLPDSIVDFCMAGSPKEDRLLAKLNDGLLLAEQKGELKQNYEKWFTGVESSNVLGRMLDRWLFIGLGSATVIGLAAWGWFHLSLRKARRQREEVERLVVARTRDLEEANNRLRFSEEKFSKAFMASPDSICLVSLADNTFIEVNDAFAETFGFTRAEAIGKTAKDLKIWTTYSERDRLMEVLKRDGRVRNAPYFFRCKDGEVRTGLVSMEAIRIGDADCMAAIMRDVTENERATAALRESEARFRTLVESAPEAILVIDTDTWVITDANENALKMIGAERGGLLGANVDGLFRPASGVADGLGLRELALRAVAGQAIAMEGTVTGLDGRTTDAELRLVRLPSARSNLVRALITDVSERRRLEEQLRHSQRMEAIGQLAGGIAHDFNNILTVIQCNATLILQNPSFPQAFRDEIAQIEQSSSFAAGLTRQLLVFSRRQVIQRVPVNVGAAIRQTGRLLGRVIGETISLKVDVPHSLPLIHADTGMIEQVLLNLAVNARDAMPKGGTLTSRLLRATSTRPICARCPRLAPAASCASRSATPASASAPRSFRASSIPSLRRRRSARARASASQRSTGSSSSTTAGSRWTPPWARAPSSGSSWPARRPRRRLSRRPSR